VAEKYTDYCQELPDEFDEYDEEFRLHQQPYVNQQALNAPVQTQITTNNSSVGIGINNGVTA